MKALFRFEDCMELKPVQQYILDLIILGHEIYVISTRPEFGSDNSDIFDIVHELGINKENVIFTSYHDVTEYLKDDIVFYVDVDTFQLATINMSTQTKGIDINLPEWEILCNRIINET